MLRFQCPCQSCSLQKLGCACLQAEGIAHVVQQLTSLQTVPNLDTPEYSVLKKTKVCMLSECLWLARSSPQCLGPAGLGVLVACEQPSCERCQAAKASTPPAVHVPGRLPSVKGSCCACCRAVAEFDRWPLSGVPEHCLQEYEVRQYSPFLVADTSMPRGRGPAAGEGFTDLANYIFGGNDR